MGVFLGNELVAEGKGASKQKRNKTGPKQYKSEKLADEIMGLTALFKGLG